MPHSSVKGMPRVIVVGSKTGTGEIRFFPTADESNRVTWTCVSGDGYKPEQLPDSCAQTP